MAADCPVATVVTKRVAPNGLGEGRLFVTNRLPEGLKRGYICPGQAQFVIRIDREGFRKCGQRHREALMKDDALAIGRPRRSSDVAARSALATCVVDAAARVRLVLSHIADLISGKRRGIDFHSRAGG